MTAGLQTSLRVRGEHDKGTWDKASFANLTLADLLFFLPKKDWPPFVVHPTLTVYDHRPREIVATEGGKR